MIRLTKAQAAQMGLTKRGNKYNARITEVDGIKFQSAKEARYYTGLLIEKKAHPSLIINRQVPYRLPGGVVYRLDFLEMRPCWMTVVGCDDLKVARYGPIYHCKFVDVKGHKTREYINKKKQVEAIYGFKITEV